MLAHRRLALTLLGALLPALAAPAGEAASGLLEAHGLEKARVSLAAVDLATGNRVLARKPRTPRIPASNMKLLTTAAALAKLGPDFRFRTQLRLVARGERPPVVVVRGSGDPAFGDRKILQMEGLTLDALIGKWIGRLEKAGVERVARLVVDDRVFDRRFVHPDWPRDQLNRWYCAQVAGFNFHDNCLNLYPAGTRAGEPPRVKIRPPVSFIETANKAVTGEKNTFWVSRKLGANRLTFHGKVKGDHRRPTHVTVHNPPRFFARFLAGRLRKNGIKVATAGVPGPTETLPKGKLLHTVATTLRVITQRCNKDSQNLFAEALLKRLGHEATGDAGGWDNGTAAVKAFMRDRVGRERAARLTVADGSGMSRSNRITAGAVVRLLRAIHADDRLRFPFRVSLAVGGRDGTLSERFTGALRGRVFAKSGYLDGVSALSGYVFERADPGDPGRGIAFSFLFNRVPAGRLGAAKKAQAELLRRLAKRLAS